jgi:hypothetical protein
MKKKNKHKEKSIARAKAVLGAPVRNIEITDEQFDNLYKIAQNEWLLYSTLAILTNNKQLKQIKDSWLSSYLIALTKEVLGHVRGKFSGYVHNPNKPIKSDGHMNRKTLNYVTLLNEGADEKRNLQNILR